jgi:hypothetical protein
MKGWNICDEDLLIEQYESERSPYYLNAFSSSSHHQSKAF